MFSHVTLGTNDLEKPVLSTMQYCPRWGTAT